MNTSNITVVSVGKFIEGTMTSLIYLMGKTCREYPILFKILSEPLLFK